MSLKSIFSQVKLFNRQHSERQTAPVNVIQDSSSHDSSKLVDIESSMQDDSVLPSKELDNLDLSVLLSGFSDIIREFDSYKERTESTESKELIKLFQYRVIEAMVQGGLTPIDEYTTMVFDIMKHSPIPYKAVEQGSPIQKYERIGLCDNRGKVYLRAQVIV